MISDPNPEPAQVNSLESQGLRTEGAAASGHELDTKTIVGGESIIDGSKAASVVVIGGMIGKYQIRSQLGVGGMGAVYLAFDPLIEREVAIKVLTQDVSASKIALQRFLQEARSIGKLNHPNVVSIYDIDQWNGQYYLVMELLSGGSLEQTVAQRGPLPWHEACGMIAQAAGGLAAAHAAGMVHRDVKPENLMQTKDGLVKVVDFGLSKLIDAADDVRTAVTRQGQILGTPQYMSPEQFESVELDSRTDIYSLGASLFRLLTGRFPFQDSATIVQTMMAHLNKPVPNVTALGTQIPAECDRIISRAMAKSPADRYQNAFEMAEELTALVRDRSGAGQHADRKSISEHPRDDATTSIADEVRTIQSVVIVEPSRMLAAMMKDAVTRIGVSRIDALSSKEAAFQRVGEQVPDLLITAMQLPDGRGIDLISELCRKFPLNRTCIVLNSSDSSIEDLIVAGSNAIRILAPKSVRADDVLRVVHAAGPCIIDQGPIAMAVDPLKLRLVIASDQGKVPDRLADLVRQIGLLDVAILTTGDGASLPDDDVPTVVLRLWSAGRSAGDDCVYARASAWTSGSQHLFAEIQVDAGSLYLRAVFRKGVTASLCRLLDAERLKCLLQACRST